MVSMHLVKGDSSPPLEIQLGIKKHSCTPCKGYCTSRVCTVHPLKILFILALTGSIRKAKKGFACGNISMFQTGTRLNSPSLLYKFSQLHWRNTSFMRSPLAHNGRLLHEPGELLISLMRHRRMISNQIFGQT